MSVSQSFVHSDEDIQQAITGLATKSGSGLLVPSGSFTFERSAMIVALANGDNIPAVYAFSRFAHNGGLIAYSVDLAVIAELQRIMNDPDAPTTRSTDFSRGGHEKRFSVLARDRRA